MLSLSKTLYWLLSTGLTQDDRKASRFNTCFALASSGSTPSVCLCVHLSATLLGCLVCVICNSNSFHSYIFKLCLMIVHTLKMCTSYFGHI